jgi:predicted nucleotidyltransferase
VRKETGLSDKTVRVISDLLLQHPEIERVLLFGSRAKGTYKPGSDIDLAVEGVGVSEKTLFSLSEHLVDSSLPYLFSLVHVDPTLDKDLAAHIARVGIPFYQKKQSSA